MLRTRALPWARAVAFASRGWREVAGASGGAAAAYSRQSGRDALESSRLEMPHMPVQQYRIGGHALQWHEHTPLSQVRDDIRASGHEEEPQGPLGLRALDEVEVRQPRPKQSMRKLHVEPTSSGVFLLDRSPNVVAPHATPATDAIRAFVQELKNGQKAQLWNIYECDSVRKKRRRKMNKHKHRKAKKKQRFLLRKLGKI